MERLLKRMRIICYNIMSSNPANQTHEKTSDPASDPASAFCAAAIAYGDIPWGLLGNPISGGGYLNDTELAGFLSVITRSTADYLRSLGDERTQEILDKYVEEMKTHEQRKKRWALMGTEAD